MSPDVCNYAETPEGTEEEEWVADVKQYLQCVVNKHEALF